MSDKHQYTVHRAMHGDGKDYERGDTREMTEVDAAPLVATGALARKGEVPMERAAAVEHTFGQRPADDGATFVPALTNSEVSDSRIAGRRSPARKG
jgi:hypothetical protein